MIEVSEENRLQLVIRPPANSDRGLLASQMELFSCQIEKLQSLIATQCSLTGVNPLSQEMAAGALSIKIGKRPRDLLNPKAVKYMQSVFSIKDAITKRETREISALFGVTVTQVREFFNAQRTRVRKYVRSSREKALISSSSEQVEEGFPISNDPLMPIYPVPLNCMEPASIEEGACSTPVEMIAGLDESERHFQENVFSMMRKEETFCGQVKLMEWILQIQNSSLLYWFLINGGVMILATWLSQASGEEQTSVLDVILKVLCHLPLHKALPAHMSAILQSVNKLRFYRTSDISNRARTLLSRWSKMLARTQTLKRSSAVKTSADAENEMLLKQSMNEILGGESWESKHDLPGHSPSFESSEHFRRVEATQPPKLLPASADDSNKKLILGVSSSQTRGRRKVLMVEQPGQKPAARSPQVARSATANQSRPLSADDIQKAKMRAHFMQSKHGRPQPSQARTLVSPSKALVRPEVGENKELMLRHPPKVSIQHEGCAGFKMNLDVDEASVSPSKALVQPKTGELKDSVVGLPPKVSIQQQGSVSVKMNLAVDEPLWKKCQNVQIQWKTPTELKFPDIWSVGVGESSEEVKTQLNRTSREKEMVYRTSQEIPCNPNEPWDREMETDDIVTPEVPIEQLPDNEQLPPNDEQLPPSDEDGDTHPSTSQNEPAPVMTLPQNSGVEGNFAKADPQLLAELLRHPELVFALQSGGLSSEEMVKLLDHIKANGVAALGSSLANGGLVGAGRIAEESAPVSLPSPTPSSDPVMSGWRPEVAKNPFSRREREAVSTSSVVAVSTMDQPQLPRVAQALPDQAMFQYSLPHTNGNVGQLHPGPSHPPGSPNLRPVWAQNSGYVDRVQVSMAMNRPTERQLPLRQPSPPSQPQLMLEHSWRPQQNQMSTINPHYTNHPHRNNHNVFVRQYSYREQNDFVGQGEFESWSPEGSPTRYLGWDYPESRLNPSPNRNIGQYNYRAEFDQPRHWSSSGYRDFIRHGGNKRRRR